jgi:hypothetical protein
MVISDILQLKPQSHKKIEAQCDGNYVEKCISITSLEFREYNKKIQKYGKFLCANCSRLAKTKNKTTFDDEPSKTSKLIGSFSPDSHEIVHCLCDFHQSPKCSVSSRIAYRDLFKNVSNNRGQYVCFYCSRFLKYSSDLNPNKKYNYSQIDLSRYDTDPEIAYFLGWLASDGHINHRTGTSSVQIKNIDIEILEYFKDVFKLSSPIIYTDDKIRLSIHDKKIAKNIRELLHLPVSNENISMKKSHIVRCPHFQNTTCLKRFIQGVFEGDGHIRNISKRKYLECSISSCSPTFLKELNHYSGNEGYISSNSITWSSDKAMSFLKMIYSEKTFALARKYDMFTSWKNIKRYEKHNI